MGLVSLLLTLALGVWWFFGTSSPVLVPDLPHASSTPVFLVDADVQAHIDSKQDLIRLATPLPGTLIRSPLTIQGVARGFWFFEASFPIVLTDWDGRIIAEGYASADENWMTDEFIPFTATLAFTSPVKASDPVFMQRGALILRKDNPSGLPENDDALEIPVQLPSVLTASPQRGAPNYGDAINAAHSAADLIGQ